MFRIDANFLLQIINLILTADGANILGIFPSPSISHQKPFLALSKGLALKGHNVTILTANPHKTPIANLKEYDFSSIYADIQRFEQANQISFQKRLSPWMFIYNFCTTFDTFSNYTLENKQFKTFISAINGTNYDAVVVETVGYSFLLGIKDLVGNPPVIGAITFEPFGYIDETMGNPPIPSYVPSIYLPYSDKMSFLERFDNFLIEIYLRIQFYTCQSSIQDKYLKKMSPHIKNTSQELEFSKNLLLISSDLASGYSRPLQPNTVHVGPLHIEKEVDPLPQDLKTWLDDAKDGVIYFSLGSNMKGKSVPAETRQKFIDAFKKLPKVRILWKWEADTPLPGKPDNVLVSKWFPQKSIFAHPKLKVFISQVGLQSFQEAISHAIPILGIPLFADQEYNSKRILKAGAGLHLEYTQLTTDTIYDSLNSILTNSSYKENMKRLSIISKDRILPPVETAIWWIEYVIRHNGAPHLKPGAAYLTWYQHYMLDIIGAILSIIIILVIFIYYIIRKFFTFISKIFCKKDKIKKN